MGAKKANKEHREKVELDFTKIHVKLEGLAPLMFDRFINHDKEERPPEQKLYLGRDNLVVFPSDNIDSFLYAQKPPGAIKTAEKRAAGEFLQVGQGHVFIDPINIPILDGDGKSFTFEGFNEKVERNRWEIVMKAGRTIKGNLSIKQEARPRPVLLLPWTLKFTLTVLKNTKINEAKLYNWFVRGGLQVGLGTYRPKYGRFMVSEWDVE